MATGRYSETNYSRLVILKSIRLVGVKRQSENDRRIQQRPMAMDGFIYYLEYLLYGFQYWVVGTPLPGGRLGNPRNLETNLSGTVATGR